MMDYESFKEAAAGKIKEFMSEEYRDYKVEVRPVMKVNQTLDSLNLFPTNGGQIASPTVYLNHLYQHYVECGSLSEVLRSTAEVMEAGFNDLTKIENPQKMFNERRKDNIIMSLLNTEQNQEILENVPHRPMLDLSIVYRWVAYMGDMEISSALINSQMARGLGFGEKELYQVAMSNTKRLLPPTINSMEEVMRSVLEREGMEREKAEEVAGEYYRLPNNETMYIISNELCINGSVGMLYGDVLDEVANRLEGDVYIIPSSINEIIAVSTKRGEPEVMAEFVKLINMAEVDVSERLSNQVYRYDKESKELTLATDTPNKRLV